MSDGLLVVQFPALQQASADIQKALNTLDSQLDQLERDAAPLVQTWEGEAQQAYAVRQARWRQSQQELSNMLRAIKQALDESAQDYLSTEKKNTSLFQ
ncbi:WXG100 family type VII secretion target [Micromonospora sp. HM5-17]|jgi:WXG100 family type VII secretion target|uniref:WXG100 family type VII secretion target n=1 Tax=Micromonospora sp. HM5-17 TaxID=2487710 RepID=UPI000F47E3D6|nr:WXG100 family type VII secretion target [Micromonospora sp. HM5-17]ROT33955.1 WXG100 family type VII secretion target [Micromonospora sp. HM5-17]